MEIYITAPPTKEPLDLESVKAHIRALPGDHSDDVTILQPLITAAREYCENKTGLSLAPQTITAYPDSVAGRIYLPRPPVIEVLSVTAGGGPVPYTRRRNSIAIEGQPTDEVEITYTAGMAELPRTIRQAMLLLIGHWEQNREATGTATAEIELGVKALLNQHKVWWF